MGHLDDYRDEMERLSSQTADEVLSGHRSGSGAVRVAGAAVDGLRQALLVPPAPEVAERHLSAMRAAAGSDPRVQTGIAMQKRTRKRFASLAMAATLVLGAGIAGALTLPEQASEVAKQRIEELQPPVGPAAGGGQDATNAEDSSDHGKAVSAAAHDDTTKGCEHGRAVSGLASSKAADNRQNEGDHPGPCGPNEGNNGNHGLGNNGNHGLGNNGNHGQSSNAGGQGSNVGGNGKNGSPQGQGVKSKSNNGHGSGGSPETHGAPDDLQAPKK